MSKDSNIQDELSTSMTGGRLKRYAKVTTAMGGLAARLAGEKYLGIKINREQHASDLRAAPRRVERSTYESCTNSCYNP